MIINSSKIKEFKFKNYTIDFEKTYATFSTLNDCIEIFLKNNIHFMIGGSIALILQTNKIYRTVGDVDVYIQHSLTPRQTQFLLKNNFLESLPRGLGKNLFLKNNISIEFSFLIFRYVDIIKNAQQFNYINNIIKLLSVKDILDGKSLAKDWPRKQKHDDDIEFYSKYV